jgi:hypothetical protein
MKKTVSQLFWEVFPVGIGAAILQAIARWMLHKPNATWHEFAMGLATWTFASAVVFTIRYLWSKGREVHP